LRSDDILLKERITGGKSKDIDLQKKFAVHKRTRRIYLEEGLNLWHRRLRRSKATLGRY
jgi:hypothetical protein